MFNLKQFFRSRTIGWYVMAFGTIVALGTLIFYVIHSPGNVKNGGETAFDGLYFAFLILGIAAATVVLFVPAKFVEWLAPLGAVCLGVAFGLMAADMLPTASDVWNQVVFIGGDFGGYLAYTILSGVAAIITIIATFFGVETKK